MEMVKVVKNKATLSFLTAIALIWLCACLAEDVFAFQNPQKIHTKISANLNSIIKSRARFQEGKMMPPAKAKTVDVVFELSPKGINLNKLASHGVVVKSRYKNLIEAKMPPENIENIVKEFDKIQYARLPKRKEGVKS